MQANFFINSILFLLITSSNLLGNSIPKDYTLITCTIKPFIRHSKKHSQPHRPKVCQPNQKHQMRNSFTKHAPEPTRTISRPNIPGPKSAQTGTQKAQQTSTNWSGYVGATNLNNPVNDTVTGVYGSWIVPDIVPSTNNTYSAIWIGIDGYSNGTVEQIGTGHDYVNGKKRHYAWFEMFPRASYNILGFPVYVGDEISASVEYSGNNVFTLYIVNHTRKVATTIPTRYTKSRRAKRSCAEWIVEAPASNHILPLTNFQVAYLSDCKAKINGTIRSLNNIFWQNTSLEMVTNNGTPKAIPSSISGDDESFSVVWKHQ